MYSVQLASNSILTSCQSQKVSSGRKKKVFGHYTQECVFDSGPTRLLLAAGNNTLCQLVSQPLGIISGLTETLIKKYVVERTNTSEIRSEEQSEKTESCRENLWNQIQLKGP